MKIYYVCRITTTGMVEKKFGEPRINTWLSMFSNRLFSFSQPCLDMEWIKNQQTSNGSSHLFNEKIHYHAKTCDQGKVILVSDTKIESFAEFVDLFLTIEKPLSEMQETDLQALFTENVALPTPSLS